MLMERHDLSVYRTNSIPIVKKIPSFSLHYHLKYTDINDPIHCNFNSQINFQQGSRKDQRQKQLQKKKEGDFINAKPWLENLLKH